MNTSPLARLRAAVDALADTVGRLRFELPPHAEDRNEVTAELQWSLRGYVLPRLADLDAPAVVVLLGGTGSGKSTLLNTLAGAPVSRPGALRPTTRVPVVWSAPGHTQRYREGFLGDAEVKVVERPSGALPGVTIVDAPDVDSVETANRELADDLLAVADLVVFVTTAQRYADAVPWEVLRRAGRRGVPLTVVLNRLPADGAEEIVAGLRELLADVDRDVPLLTVAEQEIDPDHSGLADQDALRDLRHRLNDLSDPHRRQELVAEAVTGALEEAVEITEILADEVDAEREHAGQLVRLVEETYSDQADRLLEHVEDGTLVRDEVLARWQELVGTGEILKAMSDGITRLRRWVVSRFQGELPARAVTVEAGDRLVTAAVNAADRAARASASAWDLDRAGTVLLTRPRTNLWAAAPQTHTSAEVAIDRWIGDLAELVEDQGEGRQKIAKVASVGVNAAAATVLLAVFAQTGGLTGAEVGVAAGAAAVQQRVLEHLFGSAAARTIVAEARSRLEKALAGVLEEDAQRFEIVAQAHTHPHATADELRRQGGAVQRAVREWAGGSRHG